MGYLRRVRAAQLLGRQVHPHRIPQQQCTPAWCISVTRTSAASMSLVEDDFGLRAFIASGS